MRKCLKLVFFTTYCIICIVPLSAQLSPDNEFGHPGRSGPFQLGNNDTLVVLSDSNFLINKISYNSYRKLQESNTEAYHVLNDVIKLYEHRLREQENDFRHLQKKYNNLYNMHLEQSEAKMKLIRELESSLKEADAKLKSIEMAPQNSKIKSKRKGSFAKYLWGVGGLVVGASIIMIIQ